MKLGIIRRRRNTAQLAIPERRLLGAMITACGSMKLAAFYFETTTPTLDGLVMGRFVRVTIVDRIRERMARVADVPECSVEAVH